MTKRPAIQSKWVKHFLFFVGVVALQHCFLYAGTETYTFQYAKNPIIVDGVIDEKEWSGAQPVSIRYEVSPRENTPAPVRTDVLLKYDEKNIYIAFQAFDPDVRQIRAQYSDRDSIGGQDCVSVYLDTFDDQKKCYVFACNPLGIQQDSVKADGESEDLSWDTIWVSKGIVNGHGFSVEMSIPFKALTYPSRKNEQVWRISLFRQYPREFNRQLLSNKRDRNHSNYMSDFNTAKGIVKTNSIKELEINPSVVYSSARSRAHFGDSLGEFQGSSSIGLDVRYSPASNMIINSTFNPDFTQVEADALQLDINRRFTLYYEEKRPFFLEENTQFQTLDDVFYSRTVSDPSVGAKITGKTDSYSYGAFVVQDSITNFINPGQQESSLISWDHSSTASVLRFSRNVFRKSSLGFIFTNRNGGDYSNNVFGVDGRVYLSSADTIDFQGLLSKTQNPTVSNNDSLNGGKKSGNSFNFLYYHDSRNWSIRFHSIRRTKDFRADLGYITQVDFQKTLGYFGRNYFPKNDSFISEYQYRIEGSITKDLDGNTLESAFELRNRLYFQKQSYLLLYGGKKREFYKQKEYRYSYFRLLYGCEPSKFFSFDLDMNGGKKIDYVNNRLGDYISLQANAKFKFSVHSTIDVDCSRERLKIGSEELYNASILQLKWLYNFSSTFFVKTIVHHTHIKRNQDLYADFVNSDSKKTYAQILLNYKVNPKTLCYLGFSSAGFENELNPRQTFNQTLFFKVSYVFNM